MKSCSSDCGQGFLSTLATSDRTVDSTGPSTEMDSTSCDRVHQEQGSISPLQQHLSTACVRVNGNLRELRA